MSSHIHVNVNKNFCNYEAKKPVSADRYNTLYFCSLLANGILHLMARFFVEAGSLESGLCLLCPLL
ncbi:hypothetical protein HanHA89_Chr13g0515051 [Helianthus annuus]|nr:hypothetical protein HanHA89_Chr13g0515051 [Helianthus annuus]